MDVGPLVRSTFYAYLTAFQSNSEHNDWEQLNAALTLISKRRQQNKAAITAVVQEAMTYVDQAPDKEAKRALIVTLRDITGRFYFLGCFLVCWWCLCVDGVG
jgi:hypothetical protein